MSSIIAARGQEVVDVRDELRRPRSDCEPMASAFRSGLEQSLQDQIQSEKPGLNNVELVDALLRGLVSDTYRWLLDFSQGALAVDELTTRLSNHRSALVHIFTGSNRDFYAPPWNSPEQLGTYIATLFCYQYPGVPAVARALDALQYEVMELVGATGSAEVPESALLGLLNEAVAWWGNVFLGLVNLGSYLRVEFERPTYPILTVSEKGTLLLTIPFHTDGLEEWMATLIPEHELHWGAEGTQCEVAYRFGRIVKSMIDHYFDRDAFLPARASKPVRVGIYHECRMIDDCHSEFLAEYRDAVKRRASFMSMQDWFWTVMHCLAQGCRNRDQDLPAWLRNVVAVAPYTLRIPQTPN